MYTVATTAVANAGQVQRRTSGPARTHLSPISRERSARRTTSTAATAASTETNMMIQSDTGSAPPVGFTDGWVPLCVSHIQKDSSNVTFPSTAT
nr:hypothetical protein GCM10020093_035030 [Planobispora longispora]